MFRANGTQEAPYIINMDYATRGQSGQTSYVEVTYKDEANFYFKIDGANSSGTYCVDWDKENKIVRFTYYSSANTVCYTRKNENSAYYTQAGTTPRTTTATTDYASVEFKIETIEKCDGTIFYSNANGESKKERAAYVLKNAPLKNEPNVPHPSYFVFTKSGTAKELFDSVSKANCSETDFKNKETVYSSGGLFGTKKFAELIIDPSPVMKNNLPEMTIRYGDWNGSEVSPEVTNEEKYKVDVLYHFIGDEIEEEEQAGVIETALTWLLIGIGEVFMFVIRLFLGSSVTMDSIIFNRYDTTVIDFRGRAGMFANSEVKNIINTMYSGFEWLAIIAFVVILLYIGIQIVISVGTEKQSKYFKYLEHWVVGVAILFIFPRFFPYITDISNGIVSYLGKAATPMYTQYNVIAILDDEAVIGENAQTAKIDELIGDATKAREEQIASLQKEISKKESSNLVTKTVEDLLDAVLGYIDLYEDEIFQYVDDNIDNWSYINEDEFEEKIKKHRIANSACKLPTYLETKISKLVKYKNNSLEIKKLNEEILALENYTSSGQDLMSTMRAKAGKTGRIVYAVIWLILLLQMISLLAMYYKRMIMVAILVMIFPIVMIAYAIDKAGDGKAQTFETWTKEFTVNIIVQIAHAIVYVFLIKTGLDIYEANPDNWLFLVLAVMILFPMERLFRTLFGINGNTIGQLRSNIAGGVMLAKTAFDLGKGTGKLAVKGAKGVGSAYNATKDFAKDAKDKGLKNTIKNRGKRVGKALNNYDKKAADARNATDRKRQAVAERKKNARDMNIQRRREQMEKAGSAKKAMLKTMNAASMVRNGMYYAGNAGRKVKRGVHKVQNSYAGKSLKLASNALRRGAGITAGTISGVTNAVVNSGKNGMTAGINQGISVGKSVNQMVGGAKAKSNKSSSSVQVPTTGSMPYHTRKNMPAGQKYTRAKKTSAQKVKNSATKTKTTKTRIKGVKREIHEK